jgi:hypothetical protein
VARHFPDFLDAYVKYAQNEYAPKHFTEWVGISILAAAVERKVYIREKQDYRNYPNLYTILVAGPGIGKSSAIRQGIALIDGIRVRNSKFKKHEGVCTSAALRKEMNFYDHMPVSQTKFTSIFLVGREGSESPLKNHGDDFRSAACSIYDSEDVYQFSTAKDGSLILQKPVMNMLVGATFDFMGGVVDQESAFGGLASRFTYVIEKNDKIGGSFFDLMPEDVVGLSEEEQQKLATKVTIDPEMKAKLTDDLYAIHRLEGHLKIHKDCLSLTQEWYDIFCEDFNAMESSRMRAVNMRKRTLMKKMLVVTALSRSSDLILLPEDVKRTVALVERVTKDNPYMLSQSAVANLDTQSGVTQFLAQTLKNNGGKMIKFNLMSAVLVHGNEVDWANKTFDALIGAGWVKYDTSTGIVELLIDPDRYL